MKMNRRNETRQRRENFLRACCTTETALLFTTLQINYKAKIRGFPSSGTDTTHTWDSWSYDQISHRVSHLVPRVASGRLEDSRTHNAVIPSLWG